MGTTARAELRIATRVHRAALAVAALGGAVASVAIYRYEHWSDDPTEMLIVRALAPLPFALASVGAALALRKMPPRIGLARVDARGLAFDEEQLAAGRKLVSVQLTGLQRLDLSGARGFVSLSTPDTDGAARLARAIAAQHGARIDWLVAPARLRASVVFAVAMGSVALAALVAQGHEGTWATSVIIALWCALASFAVARAIERRGAPLVVIEGDTFTLGRGARARAMKGSDIVQTPGCIAAHFGLPPETTSAFDAHVPKDPIAEADVAGQDEAQSERRPAIADAQTFSLTGSRDPFSRGGAAETSISRVLVSGTLVVGARFAERFRIVGRAARSLGVRFDAVDEQRGEAVVVESLSTLSLVSPELERRFFDAADRARAVDEPCILQLTHAGVDGACPYLVWRAPRFPAATPNGDWAATLRLAESLARAVAVAHAAGVAHLDLRPANVFAEEGTGHCQLLGVGAGAALAAASAGGEPVFSAPEYLAPEQCRGERADARTDIWGLGATLYWLATGAPPFAAAPSQTGLAAVSSIVSKILLDDAPGLATVRTDAPPAFADVIASCLDKNPGGRPRSALEIGEALARIEVK